jgi:hypothetical protein
MEKIRAADPKLEALTHVVQQWALALGERRVSVKEVIDTATMYRTVDLNGCCTEFKNAEFREALLVIAGDGGAINSKRLGKWLAANSNRIVNGKRIVQDGILAGIGQWKLHDLVPV